jgi:ribosome biogenesis GTPase
MTADPAFVGASRWLGCVVGSETGVAVVLTDRGELRASYGSDLLAAVARDPRCAPVKGDWVELRRWCDGRVTIERRLGPEPVAQVLPLRR